MASLTCLCVMTWEETSVRFSCFPGFFPSLSLSFSITPFPQEQTWDWLCIGVSPTSICLTPGPASLHPHEREQQIKKRGRMEKGVRERKREVCLCPKGLVSVCLNQEVRMWRQEKQSRDIHLVCACVRVCAHMCACACMNLVELRCHICEDHSFTLVATRDDALNHWNARDNCALICYGNVYVSVWMRLSVFWDIWWRLIPAIESESENVIKFVILGKEGVSHCLI